MDSKQPKTAEKEIEKREKKKIKYKLKRGETEKAEKNTEKRGKKIKYRVKRGETEKDVRTYMNYVRNICQYRIG